VTNQRPTNQPANDVATHFIAYAPVPVVNESHRNTAVWGNEIFPHNSIYSMHAHISKATDVKFGVRDRGTLFPWKIV